MSAVASVEPRGEPGDEGEANLSRPRTHGEDFERIRSFRGPGLGNGASAGNGAAVSDSSTDDCEGDGTAGNPGLVRERGGKFRALSTESGARASASDMVPREDVWPPRPVDDQSKKANLNGFLF